MLPRIKSAWNLLVVAGRHWREDHCSLLAAGLAYYTIVSLVPLSILVLAAGGRALGSAAALGQVAPSLVTFVGPEVAEAIESLIENAARAGGGKASVISAVILLWVASIVFNHLARTLNLVWEVKSRGGIGGLILNRLGSFAMVMTMGALFLIFAALNAGTVALQSIVCPLAPILDNYWLWRFLNALVGFSLLTTLCTLIFKFLPALKLSWKDVWVGAVSTSLLISLGALVLEAYFSHWHFWSIFGAATSLMVVLIWVYFSSQIFLFGAELTWAYAHLHGSRRGMS